MNYRNALKLDNGDQVRFKSHYHEELRGLYGEVMNVRVEKTLRSVHFTILAENGQYVESVLHTDVE